MANGPSTPATAAPSGAHEDAKRANLLAVLWESHRGTNIERVEAIEAAALAVLDGDLPLELRTEASGAAHKLAGSLGTFGFDEGTRIARTAEALLDEADVDPRVLSECVVDLLEIVGTDAPDAAGADPERPADSKTMVAGIRPYEPDSDSSSAVVADAGKADRPAADLGQEGELLVVTADAELLDRLQVAAAACRRSLQCPTSPGDAETALVAGNITAMIVDLELPDDHAITLLAGVTNRHPDVLTFALSTTDSFSERVRVATAGAKGFLLRNMPAEGLLDLVDDGGWRRTARAATIAALGGDPTQVGMLSSLLDGTGIEVNATSTPAELWETMERDAPSAVLLDLHMPDIDGVVMVRAIRAVAQWQHLPILFLTAEADDRAVAEMFAAGADDYLVTPLQAVELISRLQSHVERYRRTVALIGTDPLTGVANRRLSNQLLEQLIGLAGRRAEPFSLAVIELDDHERMHNRHGLHAVENALQSVGDVLREKLRDVDVVGRWSDERFVLGLYGAERDASADRLAEMVDELGRRTIVGIDGKPLALSMSAGLAQFPTDGANLPRLFAAAERELYLARRMPGTVRFAGWKDTEDDGLDRADVVIVDDDAMLVDLLVHSLETAGHEVRYLSDGLAAAELLGNGLLQARLVLLDVGLPGMDGFSVLRVLRDRHILETTDVVMLTARSATPETLSALELGAVDFIGKPFSVPVLMERVEKILDRST